MNSPSETGARRRLARTARALEKAEADLLESARANGATPETLQYLRDMFIRQRAASAAKRGTMAAPTLLQ